MAFSMNRLGESPRPQSGRPTFGWPRRSFQRVVETEEIHFLPLGQARSVPVQIFRWFLDADNRSLSSSGCGIPLEKDVVQWEGNAR